MKNYNTSKSDVKTPSEKKEEITSLYRKHLSRAKDSNSYFLFFHLYTKIMSKLEALLVQNLINIAAMSNVKKRVFEDEDDGAKKEFFLCTVGFLEDSPMSWSRNEQEYNFDKLRQKGYVKTTRKGQPGKRWVHIALEKLELDLDKALEKLGLNGEIQLQEKPQIQLPENSGHYPTEFSGNSIKNKRIKNNTPCPAGQKESGLNGDMGITNKTKHPQEKKELNVKIQESFGYKLAKYTEQKLRKHHKLIKTPKLIKWSKDFNAFVLELKRSLNISTVQAEQRLDSVIKDHLSHLDQDYQPKKYCPWSMCDAFVKLEEAMKRRGHGEDISTMKIEKNGDTTTYRFNRTTEEED